jgi:hypothetical protein
MSELEGSKLEGPDRSAREPETPDEGKSRGPNLILLYTLIAFALAAAIAIAAIIVLPFYQRR